MNDRPVRGGLSNWHQRLGVGVFGQVLDTLLPHSCLVCGLVCDGGDLCVACRGTLPWLGAGACPVCALPGDGSGQRCGACQRYPRAFDQTVAAFRYAFPVDRLVLALKYGHRLDVVDFLTVSLSQCLTGDFVEADVIVPMPLHPRRLAERGFNQAAEIGRRLARETGIPLKVGGLIRDRDTAPQVDLPLSARGANVRGAFRCPQDLAGQRVVVVDDVMTSGASLHEAARALKSRGAATVCKWSVARTP